MLKDKIDLTAFIVWLVERYGQLGLKGNGPDLQEEFKRDYEAMKL